MVSAQLSLTIKEIIPQIFYQRNPSRYLFLPVEGPVVLFASIPRIENPSHSRLGAIPGRPPDLVTPGSGCRFAPRCVYTQDRCRREMPPLRQTDDSGHVYRCWFPVGTPEGRAAHERNVRDATPGLGDHPSRRGGCLVAGTGKAHLRDGALLRVEDLVVEFPAGRRRSRWFAACVCATIRALPEDLLPGEGEAATAWP